MKQPIYIHIGYPKAASTTLQINLFSQHPEINYLGKYYINNLPYENSRLMKNKFWKNIQKNILTKTSTHTESWRNIQETILSKGRIYTKSQDENSVKIAEPKLNTSKINVLSNEGFLNGAWQPIEDIPYRLKQNFPNSKIIIVLRNQLDLMRSLYLYFEGKTYLNSSRKIYSFEQWMKLEFNNLSRSFLRGLYFFETIKIYHNLFGKENILPLLMEELQYELPKFSKNIADFINIDTQSTENLLSAPSRNSTLLAPVEINPFSQISLATKTRNLFMAISEKVINKKYKRSNNLREEWKEYQIDKMKKIFGESNKKVEKYYGLNLNKYKYPM